MVAPLMAVLPPAFVVTLAALTAALNVVTPVLFSVSAPSAVLPPTMPVKVIAPLPVLTVSACALFTVLTKVTALSVVGGLGLAPGLCVGQHQAMAQATHGSAPDIAGKAIANPYAMIMSGKMLLEWLGRKHQQASAVAAATLIDNAMEKVITDAQHLTGDLGGKASTSQMGDAVVQAL